MNENVSPRRLRRILMIVGVTFVVLLTMAVYDSKSQGTLTSISESNSPSAWSYSWDWSKPKHFEQEKKRKPLDPIMSAMGNETLKAELGRAAWKLLHTITVKFPPVPTKEQKDSILDFIYLFAQLYPCGECARHFQKILAEIPPNATSRNSIADWGCRAHNMVNKRLNKTEFNCSLIFEQYQCGCAEEKDKNGKKLL